MEYDMYQKLNKTLSTADTQQSMGKSYLNKNKRNGKIYPNAELIDNRKIAQLHRSLHDLVDTKQALVEQVSSDKSAYAVPVVQRVEGSPEDVQISVLDGVWDSTDVDRDRIELFYQVFPNVNPELIRDIIPNAQSAKQAWEGVILATRSRDTGDDQLNDTYIAGGLDDWKIESDLGRGSEASVYSAVSTRGKRSALKIFRGNAKAYEDAFKNELKAHLLLREFENKGEPIPNVVRYLDSNKHIRAIAMEHAPGVSADKLEEFLNKENKYRAQIQESNGSNGSRYRSKLHDHISVEETMNKMSVRFAVAYEETRNALQMKNLKLADVQPRNTMYDHLTDTITFVDISLEPI